jgi:hypothetical protein
VLGIQEVEGGFPHSEILGSKLVRSSPRLIAAYHVLHRLSAPRHPPNALVPLDHSHDRCPPPARDCSPDEAGPKFDRRQGSAPRQRSERPVFGSSPKTFACLTHSAANPCGGRWSPEQTAPAGQMHYLFTMSNIRNRSHRAIKPHKSHHEFIISTGQSLDPTGETRAKTSQNPKKWWSQTGSNRRPEACKATALPTELWPLLAKPRMGIPGAQHPRLQSTDHRSARPTGRPRPCAGQPKRAQGPRRRLRSQPNGGPGTTRTSDLTLIRGAL